MRRLVSGEWFLLLAVTALAAVLRLYALDGLPPGLYHDEAYNGLDALNVLQGMRPIFFEANNGREPLFIYLVALSVSFLGRSPLAIRLVAAVLGILTVPATYFMARELLGRRVAILAALVTATTFWHLNLSRVGLRTVSLPLLTALWLWWFARGLHRQRQRDFALAGIFLGLSIYTYLAARFVPLAFLLWIAYWLWRRQPIPWRGLFLLGICALIAALPLLMYALRHLGMFLGRSAQVSIFSPDINHGDFVGTLLRHVLKTLGMFNWRGDFIPRHNLPLRPVFDCVMGLLFLLGLAISVRGAVRRTEHALVLLYWLVMLLPTILAEGAPHFLRAAGILPIVFVFPAVGLHFVWDALESRVSRPAALAVIAVLAGFSLYGTVNDYFLRHVRSEVVYYNFEAGAVKVAADINHFLSAGWYPGTGLRVRADSPLPPRRLYLDERLWRDWPSLRYLVPDTPNLQLPGKTASPAMLEDQVRLVVWPHDDYSAYLSLLPQYHLISAYDGPLDRGDLEKEARLLCVTYEAAPAVGIPTNVQAQLEHGIELLGYQLYGTGQGSTVLRLFWRAGERLDKDYSVFVHLKYGEQMVTQSDSYPAQGRYPTHLWRPGDIVADEHLLGAEITPGEGFSLHVGMYLQQTMARVQVLEKHLGEPVADAVTITLP